MSRRLYLRFSWPRSRYTLLLEEERTRLLAEVESLRLKVERQERALLLGSNSASAHDYVRRVEPISPRPQPNPPPQNFPEYFDKWEEHFDHETPVQGCVFCHPVEVDA